MKASFISPLPPTLNEQIRIARGNRYHSAAVKKRWTMAIASECCTLPKFPGKVWLSFEWQVKNFGSDPDNTSASAKFLMDSLVLAGVITKDSLMVIQSPVIHYYVRGNNHVKVVISDEPLELSGCSACSRSSIT